MFLSLRPYDVSESPASAAPVSFQAWSDTYYNEYALLDNRSRAGFHDAGRKNSEGRASPRRPRCVLPEDGTAVQYFGTLVTLESGILASFLPVPRALNFEKGQLKLF